MPLAARGEGALAVGLPDDVASGGVAIGIVWDEPTQARAQELALKRCLVFEGAPEATRALCRVVHSFSRQCAAIAIGTEPRSRAVGWWVSATAGAAEGAALRICGKAATRPESACVIAAAHCDTTP